MRWARRRPRIVETPGDGPSSEIVFPATGHQIDVIAVGKFGERRALGRGVVVRLVIGNKQGVQQRVRELHGVLSLFAEVDDPYVLGRLRIEIVVGVGDLAAI